MKLLIVVSTMAVGGAEKLAVNLTNHIALKGFDCHFFTLRSHDNTMLTLLNNKVNTYNGKKKNIFDITYLFRLRKIIRQVEPDIILCESPVSYLSVFLSGLGLKYIPRIVEIHGHESFTFRRRMIMSITFFMMNMTNDPVVLTYRRQVGILAKKYGLPTKRFHVIANGIDIAYFCKGQKNNIIEKFRILHIANFGIEKDSWTLLKALEIFDKKFNNWELIYRGRINLDDKIKINTFLKEKKLKNKIIFVEFIEDLRQLFDNASVFVLSSIAEALPMSAIEAIAMSTPCILTDVGGCSDIVEDGLNGFLIPPKRSEILAEKLLILAQDKKLLRMMSKKAREKAVHQFSTEKIMEEYIQLFGQITQK